MTVVKTIEEYLQNKESTAYDRDGFDRYCHKRKLSLSCPVIHIAGSNGKGSTAHYLEAIYSHAGYKVASFIKPQFYEVNEMISFNGSHISDADLERIFNQNKADFDKFDLTCFEIEVAIAYRYFEEVKPDLAIIECGMGGETDATNLYDLPTVLSIITSVSLEHTAYLGTTVSAIAQAKGGIIKPESPVLVGKLEESATITLREIATKSKSPFFEVEDYHFEEPTPKGFVFDYRPYKRIEIHSPAPYQLKNASLAIEATKILAPSFPVKEEDVRAGLASSNLPGRMERYGRILIDGAHNTEAMGELVAALPHFAFGKPVHALFACFRDKNIAAELPLLSNAVESVTLTTFDHPRARTEEDYFIYIGDYPFAPNAEEALKELLDTYPEDPIVICGSLAFAGKMRKFIIEKGLK
ncbi:MAG: hypothetical protein E7179_03660 [Erysipelotrichaceae bacterium]|nr:hypothetical protein [Erysipelotrichaceae bacterium]